MRLQRYLAQAGVSSRRQAEALIASGAVRVNGDVVRQLGTSVDERRDRVEVNGRRVVPEKPIYRLLLKPRACLATLQRGGERPRWRATCATPSPGCRWWRRSTSRPRAWCC